MHKLLVPVDSSEPSMRALAHAIRLAKENGPMPLHIVHAHEPPNVAGKVQIYLTEEEAAKRQQQLSEERLAPAIAAAKAASVTFSAEIVIGDVPHAIVAAAEKQGCDGIVMGTRGMSAIANVFMGSTATAVVHLAKVPVTLVK